MYLIVYILVFSSITSQKRTEIIHQPISTKQYRYSIIFTTQIIYYFKYLTSLEQLHLAQAAEAYGRQP